MINRIIAICLVFITCSCSTSVVESNSNDSDTITPIDTNNIPINSNFPFGSSELTKVKYPKHWDSDPKHYGQLKYPEENVIHSIRQCFLNLNSQKVIETPVIKNIELIKLGDYLEQSYTFDSTLQKSIDSCRYRLPNMGIYECYYSCRLDTVNKILVTYGNLLLLNPTTRSGKILNIYYDGSGDSHVVSRYFFIDNETINIYDGAFYDDGCYLNKTHIISINGDKISVKDITEK